MRELKPFQKATVKAVLRAFARKDSTHRFLIADEVGLGKTLVAGEIIRRMAKSNNKPLVVLYVCSNLSIAAQNKANLLKWMPKEQRKDATSQIDRLTLLSDQNKPSSDLVHLYTLTPDTSVPMRGARRRDGKKEERALIHALVKNIWPDFFSGRSPGYFRRGVGSAGWRDIVKRDNNFIKTRSSHGLREMFRDSVRNELKSLGLEDGMHVTAILNRLEDEKGELEVIARFRNALAAGSIEQLKPDLVIFDEFQRFRDLLEEDIDDAAARVVWALRGEGDGNSLKLLMLSATPYRPYTKQWEDEGNRSHRKEFFELLEFLYKRDTKAKRISNACARALQTMEEELRKGELGSVLYEEARKTLQKSLRAVICRTERANHGDNHFETVTKSQPTSLNRADLKVFKHLAKSFTDDHKTAAPSYWSSIPFPMQTMGPAYRTWKAADEVKDKSVQSLSKAHRDHFKKLREPAHPRLRALQTIMPLEQLKLPWIAPSAPWWPLQGLWKSRGIVDGKVLIFSRFRAAPQAIASLMSYDLEAQLLESDIKYEDLSKRRSLQPKSDNAALLGHFYPSVFLAKHTDPIANGLGSLKIAKKTIERQLRKALRDIGVRVQPGNQRRPAWSLIAALERKQIGSIEAVDYIQKEWAKLHAAGASQVRDGSETNFSKMLKAWRRASESDLSEITKAEFDELARYALSAPGVVVGRALYRHWNGALDVKGPVKGLIKCIEVSWKGLRNYLSSRLFVKALSGSEARYPETIRKAALEGNLESVLDEHFWIASKIGSSTAEQLANEILDALKVRTSNFYMHPLGNMRKRFSLRCHAAMPFTDPHADKSSLQPSEDGEKPIRADELRKAFNTPFWPHVLATTSVGQEGLDFHVWCETLLHWDLCNNPVDLEQREGRIRRYGGLAIRRKLTHLLWNKIRIDAFNSPWVKLEKMAEKTYANIDKSGLSPWWICEDADINRFIIDLPASEQNHRFEILRQQRLLYRLALGQPNQEDLMEVLQDKYGENKSLNNIGLNLSAFFCKDKNPVCAPTLPLATTATAKPTTLPLGQPSNKGGWHD